MLTTVVDPFEKFIISLRGSYRLIHAVDYVHIIFTRFYINTDK